MHAVRQRVATSKCWLLAWLPAECAVLGAERQECLASQLTPPACCRAAGIFFKHHQKHRPVELALLPARHHAQHGSSNHRAGAADSDGEEGAAGWEPHRARRRTLPPAGGQLVAGAAGAGHAVWQMNLLTCSPAGTQLVVAFICAHCMLFFIAAAESDYSEQSDQDTEGRQRPQRPRRAARQAAEEYLHELAGDAAAAAPAVGAAPAAAGGESLNAGAYESDGGEIERGPGPAGGCVWPSEWLVLWMPVRPSAILLTSLCTPACLPTCRQRAVERAAAGRGQR